MMIVMKHLFISFFILLLTLPAFSQSWCPPGATWYYGYTDPWSSSVTYIKVEYEGPAIVNNHFVKTMRKSVADTGYLYTYEDSGVIYIYNEDKVRFDTLYNFNAVPGDTWRARPLNENCDSNDVIEVIDTFRMNINGMSLKALAVEFTNSWMPYTFEDTIIERIGRTDMFIEIGLAYCAADGDGGGALRCYQDNSFTLYSTGIRDSCDASTVGVDELSNANVVLSLYPNPATDQLIIETDLVLAPYSLLLTDLSGRVLQKRDKIHYVKYTLDLHDLKPGIYLVSIQTGDGMTATRKFVRMN